MAYPTIQYNSATGSDTNPSDCAASSVTESATASGTAGGTTITFSSSVDLSACADDDTDYLWCATGSGDRHLFQITAFSPSKGACTSITVTESVDTTFTGQAWHVNGTRQTIHDDAPDWMRGWTAEIDGTFEGSGTSFQPTHNDTATPAVDDLPFTLRASSSASSRPAITQSSPYGARVMTTTRGNMLKFQGVKFEATGEGSAQLNISMASAIVSFVDCVIVSNATNQPSHWIDIQRGVRMSNCYVSGGSSKTVDTTINTHVIIDNCWFDGKGTLATTSLLHMEGDDNVVTNTLLTDGAGIGIDFDIDGADQEFWFCKNNTVYGCSSHGIALTGTPGSTTQPRHTFYVVNNLVVGNGGYGINMPQTSLSVETFDIDFNCLFNNTSGGYNGVSAGGNDITITASPFVNSSGGNYALNNNTDGGALLKGAGLSVTPTSSS